MESKVVMSRAIGDVSKISFSGTTSKKRIVIRFAEIKYPDLTEFKGNIGMIMIENIRAAMAQDICITKGGNEKIRPHFIFELREYNIRIDVLSSIKKKSYCNV